MDKTNLSDVAAALSRPWCIIVFICALWSLVTWLFLRPVEVLGSRGYLLCGWFYCIVCYVVWIWKGEEAINIKEENQVLVVFVWEQNIDLLKLRSSNVNSRIISYRSYKSWKIFVILTPRNSLRSSFESNLKLIFSGEYVTSLDNSCVISSLKFGSLRMSIILSYVSTYLCYLG